jgi:hypothetical protein
LDYPKDSAKILREEEEEEEGEVLGLRLFVFSDN